MCDVYCLLKSHMILCCQEATKSVTAMVKLEKNTTSDIHQLWYDEFQFHDVTWCYWFCSHIFWAYTCVRSKQSALEEKLVVESQQEQSWREEHRQILCMCTEWLLVVRSAVVMLGQSLVIMISGITKTLKIIIS